MEMKPSLWARLAGAWLIASGLFALAALVALGTFGRQTALGNAFVGGGAACLLLWLVGRAKTRTSATPQRPRDVAARGRTRLFFKALSSTFLLAIALVGANTLAARRHVTFDLTANRLNSLSDQTLKTLAKLPAGVRFTYFYGSPQSDPAISSLLAAYARASDKVRFELVSALREPSRVPPGFNGAPIVVARLDKAGAPPQEISVPDEQNVTSALLKLLDPRARSLYFLQGHGEIAPPLLREWQIALEAQNYSLKTLSLQTKTARIPADCAALLILAPQVDLAAGEAKILGDYAAKRGRLMILLAPLRAPLPRFAALVKTFGLTLSQGFVSDAAYRNPQWPVGILGETSRHPILRGVSADCVFPGSAPLQAAPVAPGLVPLFLSSEQSQALSASGQLLARGPFVLAAASQRGPTRAVVGASATMAIGQGLSLFGNKSLLLSSLNWVVGNDLLVSIPAKAPGQNTLQMPDVTARFAALLCVAVLPLLSLGIGALVWWARR